MARTQAKLEKTETKPSGKEWSAVARGPVARGEEFLLQIRRHYPPPRERVFAAWADAAQLEQWMCRDQEHHLITHHEQDIRTGGRWRMEVRDPRKNEVYWGQGDYLEVRPPERIVFTWLWMKQEATSDEQQVKNPLTEVTVEFFESGDGTELVLTHRGLATNKSRDEHDEGWQGCLREMEKLFGGR
jgi:uncharacterized protein YndB with AHSA1/START domain